MNETSEELKAALAAVNYLVSVIFDSTLRPQQQVHPVERRINAVVDHLEAAGLTAPAGELRLLEWIEGRGYLSDAFWVNYVARHAEQLRDASQATS